MFNSKIRQDTLAVARFNSLYDTGNTRFNAIQEQPTHNGFKIVLIEDISPYGVGLDDGFGGGGAYAGWFSERTANACTLFVRGQGGYQQNITAIKSTLAEQSVDNPLRQERFLDSISKGD